MMCLQYFFEGRKDLPLFKKRYMIDGTVKQENKTSMLWLVNPKWYI